MQTFDVGKEERCLVCAGLISFDLSPNSKTFVIGQTSAKASVDHSNAVVNWTEELKRKL